MTCSLIRILRAGGQPGFCEEPLGPSAVLAPSPGHARGLALKESHSYGKAGT